VTSASREELGLGAATLSVCLLGSVRVAWRGVDVTLAGNASTALVALLTLQPGKHRRDVLATYLWPEGGAASGAWLRQALWQLRRAFGSDADQIVEADSDTIGLRPGIQLELDVRAFEAALAGHPSRPEEALRLYRGDLVAGLALECFAWDRERLSDLYEDALAEVGWGVLALGNAAGARDLALRLAGRDPLREEAHALLIEIYGREGSRSQVVRQYRRLRAVLAEELAVAPLPETDRTYREALARTWARSAALASSGGPFVAPAPASQVPAHMSVDTAALGTGAALAEPGPAGDLVGVGASPISRRLGP
jgi:DNA-binding SARP family transcriptional activator